MKNSYITDTIAVLLIILFVYTASSKMLDFAQFKVQLEIQAIPRWSVPILLYTLPGIEVSTALLLAFPSSRLIGFYLSVALIVVFTAYIGLALLHMFSRMPCSCGGVLKSLGWKNHFFFNLFFLLSSLTGLMLEKRERRLIGNN
jgi:putative oxidoreductase